MKQFISIILFGLILWTAAWTQTDDKIPTKEFKGTLFFQVEMNSALRIYLTQEEYGRYKKNGAPEFTYQINKVINLLSSQNIPYPKEGYYQIVVLPQGEVFKNITGLPFPYGFGGIDGWPEALAFDDNRFFELSSGTYFIGLVHEFAHLVHGDWIPIYPICEGFAEAVPFYILNLTDKRQKEIALNLMPKEIYSVSTLIKRGMFIKEDSKEEKIRVQYRKTYISMYLWMRGYLETVQQKYNLNKIEALNFVLQEFKKAAALPTLKKQENYISQLIGKTRKHVFDRTNLQLLGQKSLSEN